MDIHICINTKLQNDMQTYNIGAFIHMHKHIAQSETPRQKQIVIDKAPYNIITFLLLVKTQQFTMKLSLIKCSCFK